MQPSNPAPMSQPPADPYAFLNQPQRSTSIGAAIGTLSGRGKLILGAGIIILLIILIVGAKSIFGGSKNVDLTSLDYVLGQQQELINLATAGSQEQQVMSQSYLNFTYTAMASATTDQMKMLKLLTSNGIRVSTSSYVLQPAALSQLNQAEQSSTFDSVYATVMAQQLKLYQQDLSSAYALNKSSVLKSYLAADYKNTAALITMLSSSYG